MPIILDVPLSLKIGEVLRRAGFMGRSKVRPEIENLVIELLASVKDAHLMEPAVAFKIYSPTDVSQLFSMEANSVVPGSFLPSLLPGAEELAVVVGTIWPHLGKQVTDCFDWNEGLI
jgi:hypothetical protein